MKRLLHLPLLVLPLLFLISGCTIIKPTFEQSNQYVIEKTMDTLNIGGTLKKKVSPKSRFILRSIERKITVDEPVIAMIEDQAIRSLNSEGFIILERDAHTVEHLLRESDKTLQVEVDYKPLINTLKVKELQLKKSDALVALKHNYIDSKLSAADYIISYRVLEVGIKYNSLDDGFQWEDLATARWWFPWAFPNEVERETMVRLMIRLQEVESGRITYADILESKKQEIIERNVAEKLKDYHYDYYSFSGETDKTQTKKSGLFSSLFN